MFAPGTVALAVSVIVLLFMKESPEKEGFPPISDGAPKKKAEPVATGVRRSPRLNNMLLIRPTIDNTCCFL